MQLALGCSQVPEQSYQLPRALAASLGGHPRRRSGFGALGYHAQILDEHHLVPLAYHQED